MTLNRAHYNTTKQFNCHLAAIERLAQAIQHEAKLDFVRARMALAMACRLELEAFGFESTTKAVLDTIKPWTTVKIRFDGWAVPPYPHNLN